MLNLFASKVDDGYGGFEYSIKPMGYILMILIVVLLFLAIFTISQKDKKTKSAMNTRQLVFAAISIALGMVTSFMKLYEMPTGGSITLCSMLFIVLIGYWYGPKIGIISAVAYGMLQLIVKPYVVSIPQVIFDYILAFGALGLSGLFSNQKHGLLKGYLIGILGRFVFATLSGVIFFASYAEGKNVWVYSMTYNGFYLVVEGAITMIIIAIPQVSSALSQVKKIALE